MSQGVIISSSSFEYFHISYGETLYTLHQIGGKWVLEGDGLEMHMGRGGTSWINILSRALKEIEHAEARQPEAEVSS